MDVTLHPLTHTSEVYPDPNRGPRGSSWMDFTDPWGGRVPRISNIYNSGLNGCYAR